MNLLRIIISLFGGLIYTSLRYNIGSERYSLNQLSSEVEESKSQAITKYFSRLLYALCTCLYILMFYGICTVCNNHVEASFIWKVFLWSLTVNIIYVLYFSFYPIQRQSLLNFGENFITNFLIPKMVSGYKGLNIHLSNLFEIVCWGILGSILYFLGMFISSMMIFCSLISFSIIALNYFTIQTENTRSILVGKLKDQSLNTIEPKIKKVSKTKESITISKP